MIETRIINEIHKLQSQTQKIRWLHPLNTLAHFSRILEP